MMPTNKPASCNSCSSSHFWLCLLTSCLLKALGKAYLILMRAPTENLLSWAHITKMISMRIQWWAGHKLSPRALGCASWILDCSQLQTPRFTVVLGSHLSFECWFKKKRVWNMPYLTTLSSVQRTLCHEQFCQQEAGVTGNPENLQHLQWI